MSQHKLQNEGFKSNVILPSRDMRSRDYDVEKINATEYKVTSKDKNHKVIEHNGYFWCDCGDFKDEPKNCKHIVAVKRFMNDPFVLSKAPNFRIEAIPASGISKDDRYNKFIEQLKAAYKGVKTYTLQRLKDEQPNVPFDGLNKWLREKHGMSATEYLKSIGVLLPETYFEVVEDKIIIDSLRGKKCCVLLKLFGIKNFEQVLTQLGAEIVSSDSADIDYVFAEIGGRIQKDPPSDYGGPLVELLQKRDAGKIQFGIVSRSFIQENAELIKQMDEEITDANRIVFSVENHIKESDIPKYNSDKLYWSLWYFKDWFGASGGKIRGELADYTIESELDDRKLIEQTFVLFEELYKNIHSESVKKYINRVANDEEWNKNKDYVIAPLAYIDNFSKYTAIVGRITADNVITVSVKKLTLTKNYEDDDYILSDIPRETIPKKLVEAIMENDGNNILYQGAAKQDCEENNKGQETQAQSCEKANTPEKKLTDCKKAHDELREKLVSTFNGTDYLYPQSSDFSIEGVFIEDPDIDVFKDLCEYAASDGESRYDGEWSALELYSFLHEKTTKYTMGSRYYFSLDFGGLPPVLVVLSYLSVYSEIRRLKVTFTRDKWEARGDYSSKSRVGIKYLYGKFVVDNFSDNDKHYDCERWDYIPGNYTVTDIPGSQHKSLAEYAPRSQQADALVLPDAIVELQRNVFRGCAFKHIFFGIHNYNIESGAFSECKRLECIAWPNTLYICENMFKNCINLTTVTIPEGVFGIEKGAFAGCKNLVKINIPSTIAFIEEGAFDGCDALSSNNPEVWNQICSTNKSKAKFLDDIESYKQYIVNNGYATFEDIYYGFQYIIDTMNACKLWHKLYDSYIGNLDKLNVGNYKYVLYATKNQLAKIETNYNAKIAELGWKKTRDVSDTTDYLIVDTEDIPRFTTFIAKQHRLSEGDEQGAAKFGTTPLEKAIELIDTGRSIKIITLKNFCELLNTGAVSNEVSRSRSDSFTSSNVKITKEVKEVPKPVKQESKSNIEDSIPVSGDFVVFRGILKQYTGKDSEVVIPETVTKIGERAFKDNKKLKAVTLHDGIVRIDGGAFWSCTSLQSIVIPDGVAKIDWGTFNECSALKEVTIGKGVTNIGERAFRNCKALKNLFVSDTVTYFGVSAFDGCGSLTITGYANSKAEKYALANGIKFKRIVVEDKPDTQAEVTVSNAEINREEELRRIREDNERRVREDQERQARIEAEERKKREEEDALRKAREAEQGKALEEAYRKAQEDAARRAALVAERQAREEEERQKRQAREEEERKKREEIERICREAEERRLREEAERKAKEEAERERKLREEEERKAREEAARKEELRKIQEENERRIREDQERIAREQEAIRKREEEARRAREEAERKAREEAELLEKLKADRRAQKVCQHCGGKFKGLFTKTCSSCGKKKDY